jgi:hypothetical protein
VAQTDFLPRPDNELNNFAAHMAAVIATDPALYGSTPAQSGELSAAAAAYASALATVNEPGTRTRVTVAEKDSARAVLVPLLRAAARRARAQSGLSAAQLQAMGLPQRTPAVQRSPAPQSMPTLYLAAIGGRRHELRLVDSQAHTRKALPRGAAGAQVFYFVTDYRQPGISPGAADDRTIPTDLSRWRFAGLATKSDFTVHYDAEDIGKTAHLRAVWFNRKGETGPASDEITAMIAA